MLDHGVGTEIDQAHLSEPCASRDGTADRYGGGAVESELVEMPEGVLSQTVRVLKSTFC